MADQADDPWQSGGLPFLNVAHTCAATRALGPGLRAVVWVQGCPLRCPGCIAPEWIPMHIGRLVRPDDLARELLAHPDVTGLTLSGGEPMLQAAGLAALVRAARERRDVSVICFSGYTLERLRRYPPVPGVADLLAEIDVLIDGPYVAALNDNRGLRGSSNQRVHILSHRLDGLADDLASQIRRAEVHFERSSALLVGVPTRGLADALQQAWEGAPMVARGIQASQETEGGEP